MSKEKRKVLIITCYFPPKQSIASVRFRGLARYLPEFGWEPIILTPALPGKPDERFRVLQTEYPENVIWWFKKKLGLDQSKRIQEQLGVPAATRESRKSFVNKLETFARSIILYPNKRTGWCPHGIKAGTKLLEREKIDAIISSSPPEITHLAAKELKRRYNIPWIADFRDLWTQFHYYRYGAIRKWFEKRLEIRTLSSADALVAVSKPWADKLAELKEGQGVFRITNGFDPEEVKSARLSKKFTITYTGHIYAGKQDPGLLFEAIRELIDEGKIDEKVINVRFYGRGQHLLDEQIRKYGLEEIAGQKGRVSRDAAFSRQRESQVLLLLDWEDADEKGVYPAKVFEYLAARRPVLATGGGEGVIKDLMEQTGAGIHSVDKESVKKAVLSFYNEYKTNGQVSYKGDEEEVNKYSQRGMAKKYSEVLGSVTE